MFGFVTANLKELTPEQKTRYNAVYCGICRQLHSRASQLSRLVLSYDMAFLALLLMSLYEPQEHQGADTCAVHPVKKRPWVDNECVRYAADMNLVLAYYKALDDWNDEKKHTARAAVRALESHCGPIQERYPRQSQAIAQCIAQLSELEKENCADADRLANCFGQLMAQLLVYREDLWAPDLQEMGMALGRFIYLADAAVDYRRDRRAGRYNVFLVMQTGEDWPLWDSFLVLAMGRCTRAFERLPLVQDKKLLDNILYSGVWCSFARRKQKKGEEGK